MSHPKNTQDVLMQITQNKAAKNAVLYTALTIVAGIIVPVLVAYGLGTTNETIVVALVTSFIAVLVSIARPFWGLVLFTGLLYIRPEESIPVLGGMHFTLLISVITLIGMLLHMILHRIPPVRSPFIGMMTGFVICAILSGAVAGTLSAAVMDFARLLVLVLLILNLVRTQARYQAFLIVLIVFTCYLSLYSIYLFSTGVATIDNGMIEGLARSKGTGIFSDPNDLAATIITGVALALGQVVRTRRTARVVYLVVVAIMIWAILLTNSRGGLLALITVIGGFCLVYSRRKALAVGVGAILIGAALIAAPGRMKDFDSKEESANSRFRFWQEGMTQLQLHPLTGVGYQKFPDVNDGFVAHNSFVNCFAELGFIAYFFWMGGIYLAFHKRTPKARARDDFVGDPLQLVGARLALVGYLAAVFWITRTYSPVLYIVLCLPVAQQISSSGRYDLMMYTNEEKGSVRWRIFAFCMVMLVVIRIMTEGK